MDVWMYQDSLNVVQQAAVDRFNAEHGPDVTATMVEVPGDGYEDRLRTVMGSDDQPDVFFNWGGGGIRPYVEAGTLLPLDDLLADDPELRDAFLPAVLQAGQVDGVQYGIPLRGTQPVLLFYNREVFAEAGAEPPRTWEDVLDLVEVFQEAGVTPFALAGATPWTEQMWLQYLVDRYGGPEVFARIQSGDHEGWRDPAVLRAAETVRDLVERGAFGDNFGSVSYTEGAASALLAQGRAAMHLMGAWEYSTQLADAPAFAESGLGYVPFPAMPGGAGDPANLVGNPTNFFSVTADSPHTEHALAFLRTTADEEYVRDMVANGEVPTTADAAEHFADAPDPEYAEFQYELVQRAPSFTLSWDQALPPSVAAPMHTEIQRLFNGQSTPERFTDALAALR
ncbi:sugar-binding protein [Marinitenerispora sediminis]|uniref:Sugar-binding protein n=2 Tax=Marinitenerispora sediminis TaxID=1931232 RepID=A0A368T3C7_9ACTN|nr:sugar-binding protein [Marinitenerispora sediminis]RCV56856.1 sugar-binding protein [Marinitenerispora sediminis]RCV56949.1 sugar-binding protein [Marinitenerispora sediminis]